MNFNLKSAELLDALEKVQDLAGYHFKDRALLMESLTHSSYAAENDNVHVFNQRLEFLGDAVLQIILSVYLYKSMPDEQEGVLTRMRSFLANEEATANYTRRLRLDNVLLLGKGECASGGRQRNSILGDEFEAFLGALYLDGGHAEAERLVLSLLPDLKYVRNMLEVEENPKGTLQNYCQLKGLGRPIYELISRSGPVHAPHFEVRVIIDGRETGRGDGASIKIAERFAARSAYSAVCKELDGVDRAIGVANCIIALDFDGVICDSAAETAVSGWKAARTIWPNLFRRKLPTDKQISDFREVRPYLETGYQSILMMKMLQENLPIAEFSENAAAHFERISSECGMDKAALVALFGKTRDEWIKADQADWLGWHSLYPGVADALKKALASGARMLIMTTKQERFVKAILDSNGIDFPEDNIWGLERGRKKTELLLEQLSYKPRELHFVEDRLMTLQNVEKIQELDSVFLHYADWGYGTQEHLKTAGQDSRIEIFDQQAFCKWLAGFSAVDD